MLARAARSARLATAAPRLARWLSTSPARTTLTLEQATHSSHLILNELQSAPMIQQLESVKSADKLHKWQQANMVLIQSTMRVLPQLSLPATPAGMQQYTEAFAEHLRTEGQETRAMLQQLNEQKWTVLLKHTFGCEPAARITLSEARDLAIAMVDAMQSPDVIRQMEESKTGIAANLSEQERQNLVARAVVGVQSDVIQKAGYEGDAGYAQAQVCLMEHANDAVVTASVAAATTALYARAGINLQAAIQQAMGQY